MQHIATEEQVADIMSTPLQKEKHEYFKAKMGLVSILLFGVSIIGDVAATNMQSAMPVLWHATETPIANGYIQVKIMFELVSPCELLSNAIVQEELLESARKECDDFYEQYFTTPMESMCPRPSHDSTIHRIVKGFAGTRIIGDIFIANKVVVGLGIAGTTVSAVNYGSVSTLEAEQKRQENAASIGDIEEKFNTLIESLSQLKEMANSTNFVISFLISKLILAHQIVLEAARKWEIKQVHGPLMDYFNITMPCGEACHWSHAHAVKCNMEEDKKRVYMEVNVPEISKKYIVLNADAFDLMIRTGEETCAVKYTGPRSAIMSLEDSCIHSVSLREIGERDLLMSPDDDCQPPTHTTATKNFAISNCTKTQQHDHEQFVQIKPQSGYYNIYCPYSTLAVDGDDFFLICPNYVFQLPMAITFKINHQTFHSQHLSLEQKEALKPLFTTKANIYLGSVIEWESVSNATTKRRIQSDKGHETLHIVLYVTCGYLLLLVLILAGGIFYMAIKYKRGGSITVRAVEMDRNALEMGNMNPALQE